MKNTVRILKYIWISLKKYKLAFFASFFVFGMSTVIVDAIIPVYIKKITDFLQASDITNATSAMFVVIALYLGMRVHTFIGIHLV